MKTNYLPLLVLLFVLSPIVQAQENHLAGFEQKVSGTDFTYHSPFFVQGKVSFNQSKGRCSPNCMETEVVPIDYQKNRIVHLVVRNWSKVPCQNFDLLCE